MKASVKKGLLPEVLEELLGARKRCAPLPPFQSGAAAPAESPGRSQRSNPKPGRQCNAQCRFPPMPISSPIASPAAGRRAKADLKAATDPFTKAVLDGRQLALKVKMRRGRGRGLI